MHIAVVGLHEIAFVVVVVGVAVVVVGVVVVVVVVVFAAAAVVVQLAVDSVERQIRLDTSHRNYLPSMAFARC